MKKTVREYLNSLIWDKQRRLDRWLIDHAGAADTSRTRALSRCALVGTVRRAYHPGCLLDQMLVLVGPQGCGKSSALRTLAVHDEWYGDRPPMPEDLGKWIVELSELDVADAATTKDFLTAKNDEVRSPYAIKEKTAVPRTFAVFGSTNQPFLMEDSRRLWPIDVKHFDLEQLRINRDQIWAEAVVAEAIGEPSQFDQVL